MLPVWDWKPATTALLGAGGGAAEASGGGGAGPAAFRRPSAMGWLGPITPFGGSTLVVFPGCGLCRVVGDPGRPTKVGCLGRRRVDAGGAVWSSPANRRGMSVQVVVRAPLTKSGPAVRCVGVCFSRGDATLRAGPLHAEGWSCDPAVPSRAPTTCRLGRRRVRPTGRPSNGAYTDRVGGPAANGYGPGVPSVLTAMWAPRGDRGIRGERVPCPATPGVGSYAGRVRRPSGPVCGRVPYTR